MFLKHRPLPPRQKGWGGWKGAGGEVTSDVEDPRPALKDGRGVWRELGPDQMFLRGERGEEKSGVRQLWCSHPPRQTRGERSVGVGVGGCQLASGQSDGDATKTHTPFCSNDEIRVAAF